MSAASRTVRRLRLRASSEAAVRRTARIVEDALRTATLPDGGGRILLVRRLALGRLATRVQPSTVALGLESALARSRLEWRHGTEAGAGGAAGVWFRDPLEAHVALARRLLAGPPPSEWFWSLAVPGWNRQSPRAEALREVVASLATRVEAPVALPLWFAALVGSGGGPALADALRGEDVGPLARAANLSLEPAPPRGRRGRRHPGGPTPADPADAPGSSSAAAPRPDPAAPGVAELIAAMLRAAGAAPTRQAFPTTLPPPPRPEAAASARPLDTAPAEESASARVARRGRAPHDASTRADAAGRPDDEVGPTPPRQGAVAPGEQPAARPEDGRLGGEPTTLPPVAPLAASPHGWMAPTSAGGLLFLLNVLARIGYPEWLADEPGWGEQEVARRVLARVLRRLDVPASDPAWGVVAIDTVLPRPPRRFVAPRRWREGLLSGQGPLRYGSSASGGSLHDPRGSLLLGAWQGRCPRPLLADVRGSAAGPYAAEPLAASVVAAWDTAVHRWLRRWARTTVRRLVLRPAGVVTTPTHLDIGFDLAAAEPGIRRVGLDLDPGWLPWLGRVVSFHYEPGGSA